ncbi:hypothetical protein BKA70DRAFT_1448282 [Coprinopsis sp. MPI-PUGE-AT-0042]|nr:hypothetical protein BKA70DRAFT_1448282 [Coprinopsis sp. MPI-PUGE-AT-0042]
MSVILERFVRIFGPLTFDVTDPRLELAMQMELPQATDFKARLQELVDRAGVRRPNLFVHALGAAIRHAMQGSPFPSGLGTEVARITWKLQHCIHLADAANVVPQFLTLHSTEVHQRERVFRSRNDSVVTLPDFHTAILSEYEGFQAETLTSGDL